MHQQHHRVLGEQDIFMFTGIAEYKQSFTIYGIDLGLNSNNVFTRNHHVRLAQPLTCPIVLSNTKI